MYLQKFGRMFQPVQRKGWGIMKKVFICSRYRADEKHTVADSVARASSACSRAVMNGYAPYAPHLYLPLCLDDDDPAEREAGMAVGREFLATCDEL